MNVILPKRRLFLSIPLSTNFKLFLTDLVHKYQFPGKVTPLENLHITLHFIGNVESTELDSLIAKIDTLIQDTKGFSMSFSGFSFKKGPNSMIWAVFDDSKEFFALSQLIKEGLDAADKRIYPHVTLTRNIKRFFNVPEKASESVIMVREIELWESTLGGTASVYRSLKKFTLK